MERWYEHRSHVVSRGAIDLGTSLQKKENRLTYLLFERGQPLALLQLIQLSLSNRVGLRLRNGHHIKNTIYLCIYMINIKLV